MASDEKYKELLKNILEELLDNAHLDDELIKPLRIYINDIERFSSPVIFQSKFRNLLESRDDQFLQDYLKRHNIESPEDIGKVQDAINQILDQALNMLNRRMADGDHECDDLRSVMDKLQEAKSLNSVRALSDHMLRAGEEMINKHQEMQSRMGRLAVELTMCKRQIDELEGKLQVTRFEAENDHLTGLLNRRMFDRDMRDAVERSHRFQTSLCLMLMDLDNFKQINDRWGHGAGDDVLKNFARLVKESLRDVDFTYRLGGDEFAVLFCNCHLEAASAVAERIRNFVSQRDYRVRDASFRITVSAGVALLAPSESERSLFKRTDNLLYEAKRRGRDQIITQEAES